MIYMIIGVVGNRNGWGYNTIKNILIKNQINNKDIIITGGASGVDTFAQQYAKEIGAEVRIIYPNPKEKSPDRYFNRNEKIVLNSNIIIAFNKQTYSGTLNTINYAKKQNKQVIIIN